MDQADAELLERIARGDHVFRPAAGDAGRRLFDALVGHLRELRQQGFIDLPERSVAYAANPDAGAFLMAGPCYLMPAGRAALELFRHGDRRAAAPGADRRQGDRRQRRDPAAIPPDGDRRGTERRQTGDRRGSHSSL